MKAVDLSQGLDSSRIIEIPRLVPRDGEVLVKIECSAVENGEWQVLKKSWVGMFLHSKKAPLVLGWNVAGVVESV